MASPRRGPILPRSPDRNVGSIDQNPAPTTDPVAARRPTGYSSTEPMSSPLLLPAFAIATAFPLTAQIVSPPMLNSTEGGGYCDRFGAWPEVRSQLLDGENRGAARILSGIEWRLDARSHSPQTTAAGRGFAQLTLEIGTTDLANATNDFATNRRTPLTQVFQGAIQWPDQFGTPPTRPAAWGGPSGALRVPFSTSWNDPGTGDLLTEWSFVGGTLDNRAPWTHPVGYWVDSDRDPSLPFGVASRLLPPIRLNNNSPGVLGRCNDSVFGTLNTGSYARIAAEVYGPGATNPAWRRRAILRSTSAFTAPGAPVVHSWAFAANRAGIDLGLGCNRLHTAGFSLFFTLPVPAASGNPTGFVTSPTIVADWNIALSTLNIVLQAGWADSVTGQLRLSQAHEITLPENHPPAGPNRAAVYQPAGSAVLGPEFSNRWNPVLRYNK